MTIQNPHSEAVKKAMIAIKQQTDSLEGWNLTQEKESTKLYSKSDSTPFNLLRGDYILSGTNYTTEQVAVVATCVGAKKIWDERSDCGELKQVYSSTEALFWSKVKAPWPVSPRDMVTAFLREDTPEGDIYVALVSVKDASCPEISGVVRSNLLLGGWKIFNANGGIGITYITQFDLAGSLPTAVAKSGTVQTPLCAGKVGKYLKDYGFVPYLEDYTCVKKSTSFDHSKKEAIVKLDGTGDATILTSKKMYPSGVKVKISGKASHKIVGEKIVVTGVNGSTTIKISKA